MDENMNIENSSIGMNKNNRNFHKYRPHMAMPPIEIISSDFGIFSILQILCHWQ